MRSFRKEDVVGKTVIETSGAVRGKVKDVIFNLDGAATFVVEMPDGKDWQVPLTKVTGISDHVVVRNEGALGTGGAGPATTCKFCGATLGSGSVWCPNCGKAQS